jgi:putative transposase
MPRIARVVAVGYPHHITQRGNYRQEIFADDADRSKYISFLKKESIRYGLQIMAYCLMSNHVHFVAVPEKEDSMWKVFKYAHMKYSQHRNKKEGVTGHLFQGRFFSCVMDERHTIACVRYVERNPVRAKIVEDPCLWKWSSAATHCGQDGDDDLGVNAFFEYVGRDKKGWKEFILEPDKPEEIKDIRERTRKGRVLGTEGFIEKLEEKLSRILELKPKGRPKKKVKGDK